jgi:hypothetical protein
VSWDSPEGADASLAWVLTHASGCRSVHLLQPRSTGRDEGGARLALWAEAGRIRSALPGIDVTAHLVRGDPAQWLVALQRPGTLLVLGTGGRATAMSLLSDLLDRAPGALLVVPPGAARRSGPVVAAVDGSPESVAAATQAAGLAVGRRESIVLLHAVAMEVDLPDLPAANRDELLLLAMEAHARLLQDARLAVRGRFPEVPSVPRLVLGVPREVVAGAAREGSMLALGRRRWGAGGHRWVTDAVLAQRGPPVLLVAPDSGERGLAATPPEGARARP